MASFDYDVLIIGSGFGGSVAALRAAEKGYRVGVMESGRRWKDEDIPKTQWDLPGFLWFPGAELYGIQRIEYLDDVLVLCGAGVGGGSHVYANTLYVPPRKFFDAPEWAGITDWADELAPYLDQASRMLGVVRYPYMPTDVDRYMREVAIEMGRGETFNKAPVGVYFGRPGAEADSLSHSSGRVATLTCICAIVPSVAMTRAPNRSANSPAAKKWSPWPWVMKMSVTFRSLAATQSPSLRAWSSVIPGSVSTASWLP